LNIVISFMGEKGSGMQADHAMSCRSRMQRDFRRRWTLDLRIISFLARLHGLDACFE